MTAGEQRIIHLGLQCREPSGEELIAYLREAAPFYRALPGLTIRLLRSIDRPGHFIEIVEYQTELAFQADQKRMAEDGQMQRLLARWRNLLSTPPDVEHYADISQTIL